MAPRARTAPGFKPRSITLTARIDAMTGELGLVADGLDIADEELNSALEGELIAHDLLEHVNGLASIGTIKDELQALGGLWFVRGQHGELRRDRRGSMHTIHQNVAADISRMFRDHFHSSNSESLATPRTMPCEMEDDINDILDAARPDLLGELDSEDHAEAIPMIPEYLRACRAFMRVGFRKASKLYGGRGWLANNLFWAISEAVQPHAKAIEYEGQAFTLHYGATDGEAFARCDEHYPEDDYA